MWNGLFGPSPQELELEQEKKRQEKMLQEKLAEMGLENDIRKWKCEQETQEGLVNAAKIQKEKEEDQKQQRRRREKKNGENSDTPTTNNQHQEMSYVELAQHGYQELVNAIIRPPRATYEMNALGPLNFTFLEKGFTRKDSTLMTRRGYKLECSHWIPDEIVESKIPVVIYMHGNASARVEVLPQLSNLLSLGISVFSFDFAGSGKSDGDYVSLGYFEQEDLSCVVKHLRSLDISPNVSISRIAVWGRSMGAATSIMYGGSKEDPDLACMVLDSAFCDLVQVAEELVEKVRTQQNLNIPNFVTSIALRTIDGTVHQKANFSIRDVSPISYVMECKIPALFVAGSDDDFIPKHHTEKLYEQYGGKQHILLVPGGHNDPRPKVMVDTASDFLRNYLEIPDEWVIPIPDHVNLAYPPWHDRTTLSTRRTRVITSTSITTTRQTESPARLAEGDSVRPAGATETSTSSSSSARTGGRLAGNKKEENVSASDEIMDSENDTNDSLPSEDFDVSQIGMTEERQHAIENSVAKVLAGGGV